MASYQKRGKRSFLLTVEAGYTSKGKRDRKTKTIRIEDDALLKTKKRLHEHLEGELYKFKMEVESGAYIAPEKMVFSAFVEEWRAKYGMKKLAESTLDVYDEHLENHILPFLGQLRIEQINTMRIINFLDGLEKPGARKDGNDKEGLAASTIRYIIKILRNIFKRAVEWKLIKESPMNGVPYPTLEEKEMGFLDSSEAEKLIETLYQEPIMWRMCFLTALIGGMRRGELIGLEWEDVNFEENTLSINKNIPLTIKGKPVIREPKKGSAGVIEMPEWYMEELEVYKTKWEEEKEAAGDLWEGADKEYLFHAGLGKPLFHNSPTQKWIQFRKKYNLKEIRLHDLRHTMVTLLIEAGTNIKAIQKRARHKSAKITVDTYGHITKKVRRDTAEKFDKFDPRKKIANNSSTS